MLGGGYHRQRWELLKPTSGTLMLAKSPTSITTTFSRLPYFTCNACSSGELFTLRTVAMTEAPAASSCACEQNVRAQHSMAFTG